MHKKNFTSNHDSKSLFATKAPATTFIYNLRAERISILVNNNRDFYESVYVADNNNKIINT